METVLVNVKSAWLSKTSWLIVVTAALNLIADFSGFVPAQYMPYVALASTVLSGLAVFFKTTSTTISPTAALRL